MLRLRNYGSPLNASYDNDKTEIVMRKPRHTFDEWAAVTPCLPKDPVIRYWAESAWYGALGEMEWSDEERSVMAEMLDTKYAAGRNR